MHRRTNDQFVRKEWEQAGYNEPAIKVYACNAKEEDGVVVIDCKLSLAAVYRRPFLHLDCRFTVDAEGKVRAEINGKRDMERPFLPRFGLRMFLPKSFDTAEYYGYGRMNRTATSTMRLRWVTLRRRRTTFLRTT